MDGQRQREREIVSLNVNTYYDFAGPLRFFNLTLDPLQKKKGGFIT